MVVACSDWTGYSPATASQGNSTMNIALAGPLRLQPLLPWIATEVSSETLASTGKAGTPVTQLAVALLERGHQIVAVALETGISEPLELSGPRLRVRLLPKRPSHRARDLFRAERHQVAWALAEEDVDVVHAHWHYEFALGGLDSGHPTLITVRDWAPTVLRLQSPKHYLFMRLLLGTYVLRRGDFFTVTSPTMVQRVQRWTKESVPVIPNLLSDSAYRTRLPSFPEHNFVLLATNQGFSKRKNVQALLRAYAEVRRNAPASRLILLGTQYEEGGSAHQWAIRAGLTRGVEFVGPTPHDDVISHMTKADVFVHPALWESFGMVIVEAMAQGLPVVAGSGSGAVPWVLDNGKAGQLTDVADPHALAASILSVCRDRALWEKLSQAGFEHARTAFAASNVVPKYEGMYRRISQGGARDGAGAL